MLMQEYGFHGPAMNVSAMRASGNAGLITAKMWLDAGLVDDVVFIATDLSLTPENVGHFVRLGAACRRARARPATRRPDHAVRRHHARDVAGRGRPELRRRTGTATRGCVTARRYRRQR